MLRLAGELSCCKDTAAAHADRPNFGRDLSPAPISIGLRNFSRFVRYKGNSPTNRAEKLEIPRCLPIFRSVRPAVVEKGPSADRGRTLIRSDTRG
jgi:hypothetical protein